MNKKKFKAQALAIVMVVLVVATIIGLALFTRMSKDRQAAIDEQNSAIAAELSNDVLDLVVNANIDTLEQNVGMSFVSLTEFENFLTDTLNVEVPDDFPEDGTWCPHGENENLDNQSFNFSLSLLGPGEPVGVVPGSAMSFHTQDATVVGTVNLNLTFSTTDQHAIFLFKKVYVDPTNDTVYNYCVRSGAAGCVSDGDIANFENIDDKGTSYTETINLSTEVSAGLAEIRIIPIKGTVTVETEITGTGTIDRQFYYVKAVAEATCDDSYRGAEMEIPGSGNLGYITLFDYVVYDTGQFRLKH
jgi:hypothetical protein